VDEESLLGTKNDKGIQVDILERTSDSALQTVTPNLSATRNGVTAPTNIIVPAAIVDSKYVSRCCFHRVSWLTVSVL